MHRSGAAGFTLVEMVAVLILVGLLLLFSPMAITALIPERELESEVSRLGVMIETARNHAVLNQAEYALHYDTDNHKWALQTPDEVSGPNPDGEGEPLKMLILDKDPEFDDLDWHELPEGITLQLYEGKKRIDGRFMVTLSPGGTVPPHAVILESNRIASLDEDERTRTIKVNFPGFVSYGVGRVVEDFKKTEAEIGR
jgi:prepilin-type N-terminal cleavage/methylation domain-containing protein